MSRGKILSISLVLLSQKTITTQFKHLMKKNSFYKTITNRNYLKQVIIVLALITGFDSELNAQTIVTSLSDLLPYLEKDNVDVKLKPGTYNITTQDVAKGLYKEETIVKNTSAVLLLFKGTNSTYDFTNVTINVGTKVLQAFGNKQVYILQIIGNNNVLKNLTLANVGSLHDAPNKRACNLVMDGAYNKIEGFYVTTKGSFPYGYGDSFGKGGKAVIKHQKHSSCLIRGESNYLKNSTFIHRSYGHCVFMQAANNALIEGCLIEGEVRKTDDMLAETSGPAFDVDFMTVWGYKIPKGYMMSTGEAGIRAYGGGNTIIDGKKYQRGTSNPTVINNTIKYMRTGVTLAHATGEKLVRDCVAIGCENGFSLGSGKVVNCSADCSYGPAYSSTYERDRKYDAEITILPSKSPYCNGSGNIAYIGGAEHKITFKGSKEVVEEGLVIKVGGDKKNLRLLNGSLPNQNNFKGFEFELNNLTNYPVVLSQKSYGVKVKSVGKVTDLGKKNKVKQL